MNAGLQDFKGFTLWGPRETISSLYHWLPSTTAVAATMLQPCFCHFSLLQWQILNQSLLIAESVLPSPKSTRGQAGLSFYQVHPSDPWQPSSMVTLKIIKYHFSSTVVSGSFHFNFPLPPVPLSPEFNLVSITGRFYRPSLLLWTFWIKSRKQILGNYSNKNIF